MIQRYDVVLMDINMKCMGGLEASYNLRIHESSLRRPLGQINTLGRIQEPNPAGPLDVRQAGAVLSSSSKSLSSSSSPTSPRPLTGSTRQPLFHIHSMPPPPLLHRAVSMSPPPLLYPSIEPPTSSSAAPGDSFLCISHARKTSTFGGAVSNSTGDGASCGLVIAPTGGCSDSSRAMKLGTRMTTASSTSAFTLQSNHDERPSTRQCIVAITADVRDTLMHEVMSAGFDAFIAKPFTIEKFRELGLATV